MRGCLLESQAFVVINLLHEAGQVDLQQKMFNFPSLFIQNQSEGNQQIQFSISQILLITLNIKAQFLQDCIQKFDFSFQDSDVFSSQQIVKDNRLYQYIKSILIIYCGVEMYHLLNESEENQHQRRVSDMEKEIFAFLKVAYEVKNIKVNQHESIHSVFIPTLSKDRENCENYFIGHGFGGSSLMSFTFVEPLIRKGNVIFWEIRGMGLSSKLEEYLLDQLQEIQGFFLKTIQVLLLHYNYRNSSFICHSFSSYLLLLFTIRFPNIAKNHIKTLALLSPIGITTKEEDYKNYINSCSDILHTLLNKFGWAFNLTYKSPLRTVCSCCKRSLISNGLKDFGANQDEKQIMCNLIETLVLLPDGSEPLFFKYFEPRVIPKLALEPLFISQPPVDIALIYGGEQDWVDKTGGKKISDRFPKKIRFMNFEGWGHNIPFNLQACKRIFTELL